MQCSGEENHGEHELPIPQHQHAKLHKLTALASRARPPHTRSENGAGRELMRAIYRNK